MTCTYDKNPVVQVTDTPSDCLVGWGEIQERLRGAVQPGRFLLCVECYPGVAMDELTAVLEQGLRPDLMLHSESAFLSPEENDRRLAPCLTADPVLGRMNGAQITDFFDATKLSALRASIDRATSGLIIVIGTGAAIVVERPNLLVYADLARWEIQKRQRANRIGNLGTHNPAERASLKYKRAFFVDWRAADRLKQRLLHRIDWLLDTNNSREPKMISGASLRVALDIAAHRPFRVVPFFDPGPWGGDWMKNHLDLPEAPNYAWGFDCVPEENSLLLGFGNRRVEIPALDLVLRHPLELLGTEVWQRFGAEFPIRFDLLDTMGGGNLSLQVHPTTDYIRSHFGMEYTQDESYYILDSGEDASVYLGLRDGVDVRAMARELRRAQEGGPEFPADQYANKWPVRKHDHVAIPSGTIHCSGRNVVVLEISATPYIFTFKLWDWGRLGLDGEPRPIHLHHGLANIQWNRTTEWVRRELLHRNTPVATGPGWREERTGLHELEFIETRRHWFVDKVPHSTEGTVNVLNLVEGEEVVVESPDHAFDPFVVHYAETFIVPAAVGDYTITPTNGAASPCATIKASVRNSK